MDWENEPYVRLYTRDTTNWKRLGFEGRAVLALLLRKVDRSGALDLEDMDPWEAVALHIEAPEDVCRRGVAKLLELGTLEVRGGILVFPNHVPAQTAVKSDRLRAKESRDRRAHGHKPVASRNVTNGSQRVTAPSQDATQASREITERHAASHAVTPRHSLLCSALLCSAVLCSADQRDPGEAPSEPAAADEVEPKPKPEAKPPKPRKPNPTFDAAVELIRAEYAEAYPSALPEQVSGSLVGKLLKACGGDLERARRALRAYLSDPYWLERGAGLATFVGKFPQLERAGAHVERKPQEVERYARVTW